MCVEQIRRLHPLAVHTLSNTALQIACPRAEAYRHTSVRDCTLIHAARQVFCRRQSHVSAVKVHLATRHEQSGRVEGGIVDAAVVLCGVGVAVDYVAAGDGSGGGNDGGVFDENSRVYAVGTERCGC